MKRLPVLLLSVVLGVGLMPVVASAYPVVYESGVINVPIPDLTTVTSDINVGASGMIADLNLRVLINHTFIADLVLTLTHVQTGRAVVVFSHQCGPPGSINATFDDEGAVLGCPPSGNVIPYNPLLAFDGENLGGTWRLTVSDQWGIDSGTLVSWGLYFEGGSPGRIIVKKVVSPADAPAGLFVFESTWGPDFALAGGGSSDSGWVAPGTYGVFEHPSELGWSLASAVCDDGSSPGAIQVSPNETVTCTFTNHYQEIELCFGREPTIAGTAGDDTLTGTPGPDVIAGLGGDDVISGLGGNDHICGGSGDDHIYGGLGNDSILGGPGADTLRGGDGGDRLVGGVGFDLGNGGPGTDVCLTETKTACE